MTERFFFNDWVGKTIKLTTTNPPSGWKLVTKLSDKNTQESAESYHESPSPGAAYGSFICHRANDPADVAFLRIIMQIPYGGSEYAIHAERARQASSETVSGMTYSELCAVELLRDNDCTAAPRIRTHEETTQDDTMLVPGGPLHYILIDKAGRVQLNDEIFWAYPRNERDRIREAYKEAWRYVMPYV
ncbi:hypothetical protein BJX68DRAFT_270182 [Aspergillus pseudodeflectus]|uniref:Uncharacterized protein n=1 Tax=Aspergillus pseudodeflectus TaxID=176178 RepID=A0ABR4JTS7_9EURO